MNKYLKLLPLAVSMIAIGAYFLSRPTLNNNQDNNDVVKTTTPIPNIVLKATSEETKIDESKTFETFSTKAKEIKVPISPRIYSVETSIKNNKPVSQTLIIKTQGKSYSIPLKVNVVKVEDKLKLRPALTLGFSSGINNNLNPTLIPAVGLSIINNSSWQILNVSVGYDLVSKNAAFDLSPIAKSLPILSNTFIGLSVGADLNKNWNVGASIKVRL